jgi:hypothetical protein
MSNHLTRGVLETLVPFPATVEEVLPDGSVKIKAGSKKSEIIPPPFYGGVKDSGTFMHPDVGDTLLCVRVVSGSKGMTQAIAVLAAEGKEVRGFENNKTVPIGASPYPPIAQGEVKVLSSGGSALNLTGAAGGSEVSLTTSDRSGVFISSDLTSSVTTISNLVQQITSGSRLISGDIIRRPGGGQVDIPIGHDIDAFAKISGDRRGFYDGAEAQEASFLGSPRNAVLSEYRLVVNEFSEQSAFTGFDKEHPVAMSASRKVYETPEHKASNDPRTALSLAPHQLVEIIAGNVINSRGEALDLNYGTVEVGDSKGRQVVEDLSYEADKHTSRRGIGYHFQLSTNSKSEEVSDYSSNFVCAIDKQGLFKVNVPKGSQTGNVLFPTKANLGHSSGGVKSSPSHKSAKEPIPVTLRAADGRIILPYIGAEQDMTAGTSRETGVRFSNNSGYFQGFKNGPGGTVRVNFTAHHNMYAAAEMLIANTIKKVIVPIKSSECPGLILGSPVGEPFERYYGELDADGILKNNELKYMSTVAVTPERPALYHGGETTVAGQVFGDEVPGANQPYTNSFVVSGTAGKYATEGTDKGVTGLIDPGGKSANINFEGAVDVSVGRDAWDQKSLVLDTAGSVIAWFGKDKAGRSLVVQTDGAIAVNVGGRGYADGKTDWKTGRFDLRVNVTDKGDLDRDPKIKTENGDHASDYVISISDAGLVIAGMHGAPMVIRNDGHLSLESTGKLSLIGTSVEVREGNLDPRPTHKAPTSKDQKPPKPDDVSRQISCITDYLADLLEE